jgi:RsiW-degrading membrane proteinase PrsW (M82 family)
MPDTDALTAYAHHFEKSSGKEIFFPGPWQQGRVLEPGDDATLAALLKRANRWRKIALFTAIILVTGGITAWMIYTKGKGHPPDPVLLFILFFGIRLGFAPLMLMLNIPDRPKIKVRRSPLDFWRAEAPTVKKSSLIRLCVVGALLYGVNLLRWNTEVHSLTLIIREIASLALGTFMLAKAAVITRLRM